MAGNSYTLSANTHFALARLLTDGRVDTSFAESGVLTTNINGGVESDHASSLVVQSNGKILVAGETTYARSNPYPYPGFYMAANVDFAVVRYTADGVLDGTFSGDGIVTTDFRLLTDSARSVVVQTDGSIILAGSSFTYDPSDATYGGYTSFAVARYKSDGSPDETFRGAPPD